MDAIIWAAVDEICLEGPSGVTLSKLWALLQPSIFTSGFHLCDAVKRTLWHRLVALPGLQIQLNGSLLSPDDEKILCPKDAEEIGLKVIAEEHLRDSFLGIQELKVGGFKFDELRRSLLERIARSRCNGITQDQLGKELQLSGKDIFYYLKGMECNGVIVRQPAIIKKGVSVVHTNNLYLTRFVQRDSYLNPHQRVEITVGSTVEECKNVDSMSAAGSGPDEHVKKEDVIVKDYLPAMEAVCNKLEQASGKVLVVSDLKKELGYRKTKGHRLWRNIVNRLKEAKLIEEFHAQVCGDGPKKQTSRKMTDSCLRLLRKFNPKDFQQKVVTFGYDDPHSDNHVQCHNRKGQCNEQVMELPLDQQIYDMIDGAGSTGMTFNEIYGRLGINGKKNYFRILDMCSRFQMSMSAESHSRSKVYRIWVDRNDTSKCNMQINNRNSPTEAEKNCGLRSEGLEHHHHEIIQAKDGEAVSDFVEVYGDNGNTARSNTCLPEKSLSISASSSKLQPSQRHPCLDLTTTTLQRQDRILSRLQKDKFVLLFELHRWLDSLETETSSKMDKKTLLRVLRKLEKDGLCCCIEFKFPSLTNSSSDRHVCVICHPTFAASTSENIEQIHKKFRDFDSSVHSYGLGKLDGNVEYIPQTINVERPSRTQLDLGTSFNSKAMRANGYIPAKMIRAKLLHIFLWSLSRNNRDCKLAAGNGLKDTENSHSSRSLFVIDLAIKAMPVELFLQVVGFSGQNDDLIEYCHSDLKLSDLRMEEYRCMMDTTASARLSSLVDILVRLKLIHLAIEENTTSDCHSCITVSHALEANPYIEKPPPCSSNSSDGGANLRCHFEFLERNNVEDYWMSLEDYYVQTDPNVALLTFPGLAVREGFSSRAWSSARVMSTKQRLELLKRIAENDPREKVSFRSCGVIARELNLTLGQVLCACYDSRSSHMRKFSCHPKSRQQQEVEITDKRALEKRERSCKKSTSGEFHTREFLELQVVDVNMESSSANGFEVDSFNPTRETDLPDADDGNIFINKDMLFGPHRQKRFHWNDELDRQLVMEYARYRAVRNADSHRVLWASLSNLPASSQSCRRRIAQLKGVTGIRNSIMNLCNILGERYCREMGTHPDLQLQCWDNFEDPTLKLALDEVLQCKNSFKKGNNIEDGSTLKRKCFGSSIIEGQLSEQNHFSSWNVGHGNTYNSEELLGDSDLPFGSSRKRFCVRQIPKRVSKLLSNRSTDTTKNVSSRKRFCARQIPKRVLKLLSNRSTHTTKNVTDSLSIANAVELVKLIFLSSSAPTKVQAFLVETLRLYAESDIYAAFSYLREKSFMIVGYGSQPFVLSQKFLSSATYSPFPTDTGRRAKKLLSWLHEQTNDSVELKIDLQCGEIFSLFALVSSNRLKINACLPEDGIGEVDDSSTKQDKESTFDENNKNDFLWKKDSDFSLRREKGFPGIEIVLDRINGVDGESAVSFMHKDILPNDVIPREVVYGHVMVPSCLETSESDSIWQSLASHVEHLSRRTMNQKVELIDPNMIKSLYFEIEQAGDQGLNMDDLLAEMTGIHGNFVAESTVNVLEMFQLVVKVNAYNCVHLVDSKYKSKYLISTSPNKNDCILLPSLQLPLTSDGCMGSFPLEEDCIAQNKGNQSNIPDEQDSGFHNLQSESESCHAKSQVECSDVKFEGCTSFNGPCEEVNSCSFCPIVPWIDVNGGNNGILYRGLVRRILGTVMQNPGILEEDLIHHVDVLNPQSCRQLLELMILDNHIIVRKIFQTPTGLPSMLQGIIKSPLPKLEPLFRRHLFANPMSAKHL